MASVGNRIAVPVALEQFVRTAQIVHPLPFSQIAADIWVGRTPVGEHVDNTAPGMVTYGCILVNDPNVKFFHGFEEFDIPPGTLYKMDGRIPHGTKGLDGLFSALIWDMPPEWSLVDFAAELHNDPRFT